MQAKDKSEFGGLIKSMHEVYNRPCGVGVLGVWWGILEPYPLEMVSAALSTAMRETDRVPTPAHVLKFLPDPLGHLGPEEAWNALPKSEGDSGYVTDQMMRAYGACSDSLERGDMLGARVAFIEAYRQTISAARASGEKARFWYTGSNTGTQEERDQIKIGHIRKAMELGWIQEENGKEQISRLSGGPSALMSLPEAQKVTVKMLAATGSSETEGE